MSGNKYLHQANKAKKDEFYTQMTDIEKELKYYKAHFKDKAVFCNCDDPEYSNFWEYFRLNFDHLGLKKLIATHYSEKGSSYKLELVRTIDDNGDVSVEKIKTPLNENGDFRSQECIDILKEVDLVVTNPPFSLFREYVAQLVEYQKQFIIIGNQNAITYKEVFSLIKNNKLWLGQNGNKTLEFKVPDSYPLSGTKCRVDENGNKYVSVSGIQWFTNLDYAKRHEDLILYKTYNKEDYPMYDNYEAINVKFVNDIPKDYEGVMGVPITFLSKYNPEQFEILGLSASAGYNKDIVGIPFLGTKDARPLIDGKNTYARIFIRRITGGTK